MLSRLIDWNKFTKAFVSYKNIGFDYFDELRLQWEFPVEIYIVKF